MFTILITLASLLLSPQEQTRTADALIAELEHRAAQGGGPYEIVQSRLNIRDTFRLNRTTGQTWILHGANDSNLNWFAIPPVASSAGPYSMSLSTVAAKNTFLLNERTGETWILLTSEKTQYVWVPIR